MRFLFFSTDDNELSRAMTRSLKKLLRSKRPGMAMPLAMTAVMLLLAMGVGLLSLGMNVRIYSIRTCSDIAARSAADTGLTKALFEMNEKLKVTPWDDSTLPQEINVSLLNCDADFSCTITGSLGVGYDVQSTGRYGQSTRTVSCTLQQASGPFDAAIFTNGYIILDNSAMVDQYNDESDDENVKIATNSIAEGAITLMNSATLKGDVAVGVGGDTDVAIDMRNSTTIEGTISRMTEERELTPIVVPDWLQSLPSEGVLAEDVVITSSAKYSEINLGNSQKVTISGDVTLYVVGDITLGNSAELEVEEGASLVLYIGGDFEGKNSSSVNNLTKDARGLQMYGLDTCESIRFKNSSDLFGVIYAPKADVVMDNSANVYGAVVTESCELKNSSTFYYDASLKDESVDPVTMNFEITNWYEQ